MGQARPGTHMLVRAETERVGSAGNQSGTGKARNSHPGESRDREGGVNQHKVSKQGQELTSIHMYGNSANNLLTTLSISPSPSLTSPQALQQKSVFFSLLLLKHKPLYSSIYAEFQISPFHCQNHHCHNPITQCICCCFKKLSAVLTWFVHPCQDEFSVRMQTCFQGPYFPNTRIAVLLPNCPDNAP